MVEAFVHQVLGERLEGKVLRAPTGAEESFIKLELTAKEVVILRIFLGGQGAESVRHARSLAASILAAANELEAMLTPSQTAA